MTTNCQTQIRNEEFSHCAGSQDEVCPVAKFGFSRFSGYNLFRGVAFLFALGLLLAAHQSRGASLSIVTTNLGGQVNEFVLPPGWNSSSTNPLIVVFHEFGETHADVLGTYTPRDIMFTNIINQGWILASSDAHGNNWGNQAALDDYVQTLTFALTNYHITPNKVVAYCGSMGGLPSLLTVLNRTGVKTNYHGWFGVYPVCNLSAIYTNTSNFYQSSVNAAYNIPGGGNYATQTAGHEPGFISNTNLFGSAFLFSASVSDTIAIQSQNTDLERASIVGPPVENTLFQATGAHADASHYNVASATNFLNRVLAGYPLIDPTNRIDWIPSVTVGNRGIYPTINRTNLIDVTKSPYNADNTGALDAAPAFTSAIAAAGSNDVIYAPDGYYTLSNGIRLNKSFVTIRGNTNSVLLGQSGGTYIVELGGDPQNPSNYYAVTNGYTKGSTNLVIAGTPNSFLQANDQVRIFETNLTMNSFASAPMPVINVHGNSAVLTQTAQILSVNGSTVTLTAPLVFDFTNGGVAIHDVQTHTFRGVGLENIIISGSNYFNHVVSPASRILEAEMLADSWITNCQFINPNSYGVGLESSTHVTFTGNTISNGLSAGSNHGGLLVDDLGNTLIENNIFAYNLTPAIEWNSGIAGNAFFANYSISNNINFDNHGPHPMMNLWEQNISDGYFESDGYFGSCSHQTLFRNSLQDKNVVVFFKRFNSYHQLIGNVLGSPAGTYTAYQPETYNSSSAILSLGYPNIGNNFFSNTAPALSWNWPGAFYNPAVDSPPLLAANWYPNGQFTFTNTFTTNQFWSNMGIGTFTNIPNGTGVGGGVYTLEFQDGSNTNLYWPNNLISGSDPVPLSQGTSSNLTISQTITVSNGWVLYLNYQNSCWQQLQITNKSTHNIQGNYDYKNGAITWQGNIAQTMPTSYLYTNGAPSWWGTNRWPAIDVVQAAMVTPIPAQTRFNGSPVSDPAITVQPSNQTVTAPAAGTFSVTSTGTAPLTYQWLKNGTPVGGATSSSVSTGATTTGNNGDIYAVQVTSAAGGPIQSANATLTVNPPVGAMNQGGTGTTSRRGSLGFGKRPARP